MDFKDWCFIMFLVILLIFLGMIIGFHIGKRSDEEEERIEDLLEQSVTFLVLYYLQPSKIKEDEVRAYLESIGAIEEMPEQ